MASVLNDPKLEALLDRLHALSDAQIDEVDARFELREQVVPIDHEDFYDNDMRRFLSDKKEPVPHDNPSLRG